MRARRIPVVYFHGMEGKGVRFPSGPPIVHCKKRSPEGLHFLRHRNDYLASVCTPATAGVLALDCWFK